MSAENLADISHLHARKPNHETYQDFYALYGTAREGVAILLSRVLYRDETSDHSVHVIVSQRNGSGGYMQPVSDFPHQYKVAYNPSTTCIATTDGETITQYNPIEIHGIYMADTKQEQLHMSFKPKQGGEACQADFDLASGEGSFSLGGCALGWILSASESDKLRELVLMPETIPPLAS